MPFQRLELSVVAIFHDMRREAARTLHSLSPAYQRAAFPYEVIAIDNGSSEPLAAADVARFGKRFRHLRHETDSVSPAAAVNIGARMARGRRLAVLIDGARILSPGILRAMRDCARLVPNAFVFTLGFHLGHEKQNVSVTRGYDRRVEDEMLEKADWKSDGYRLFDIACLGGSADSGYFGPVAESNCFSIDRRLFLSMGGFDEAFREPGGGLVNLDFFARAMENPDATPVLLLGEGTFHQFHGGVATNAPIDAHPWERFHEEYRRIRGKNYAEPARDDTVYFGTAHARARRFLAAGGP